MKRRSYERWCGRATTLASPASMLFGGGSNRRSGVVLQLVLWLVSELYTCCFSLVLCGVWLYSIFVAEDLCTGFDLPKVLSMKFRWGFSPPR